MYPVHMAKLVLGVGQGQPKVAGLSGRAYSASSMSSRLASLAEHGSSLWPGFPHLVSDIP